jgi:chromosome segregation ATPase
MLQFENRLEDIFDKKVEALRNELLANGSNPSAYDVKFISSSTEELVKDAIAMFRTQMRASAERELDDDSRRDARGELDFELIRSIVEQGHEDTRKQLQQDLLRLADSIDASKGQSAPQDSLQEVIHLVHDLKNNVLASNARVADRISAVEATSSSTNSRQEREAMVLDLMRALTPVVSSVRAEPLDYDALTARLSQAVKPHISQLIDLASDKRETAELIAARLMPVLQSLAHTKPVVDTENIISEMTAAINRVIAPIDAHVIKEQVSDLVVERLDARLSVRESQMNLDNLKNKVAEVVSPILERIESIAEDVDGLSRDQSDLHAQTSEVIEGGTNTAKQLGELKEQISGLTSLITDTKSTIQSGEQGAKNAQDEILVQLEKLEATINASKPEAMPSTEIQELLNISRQIMSELSPMPNTVEVAMQSMELKQAEMMKRLLGLQDSTDELRKHTSTATELQAQLVKARAAHGQIRVEKDNLSERLVIAEAERDRLKSKVEELQVNSLAHATELATLQTRADEQENAMHTALDRLKVADVNAQIQHERIAELEKINRELALERQQLKSKVCVAVV